MTPRTALRAYFAVMALNGLLSGHYASLGQDVPRLFDFALIVVTVISIYVWYHADAAARGFMRPAWLGGAVVMFSAVAVPYYLVRSRPRGQRLAALGRFVGVLVLSVLTIALCGLPFLLLRGAG